MILMVGECTGRKVADLRARGWGRMWVAKGRRVYAYPGEPWGFDNGAYGDFRARQPFDEMAYRLRLHRAREVGTPHLAVVPDLVERRESLAYSESFRATLPDDWPWYLALQDGMTLAAVAAVLERQRYAGLFLGGSNGFKLMAATWAQLARDRGLRFHYGRAATLARLDYAAQIGSDSANSTQFLWSTTKWSSLLAWWDDVRHAQGRLLA